MSAGTAEPEDTRPRWIFEIDMDLFRWIASGEIISISHHWRFTDEDKSEDWIELHKQIGTSQRVPTRFFHNPTGRLFQFSPNHRGLVQLTTEGERALKIYEGIKAWDRRHAAEIRELHRLIAKHGLPQASDQGDENGDEDAGAGEAPAEL